MKEMEPATHPKIIILKLMHLSYRVRLAINFLKKKP